MADNKGFKLATVAYVKNKFSQAEDSTLRNSYNDTGKNSNELVKYGDLSGGTYGPFSTKASMTSLYINSYSLGADPIRSGITHYSKDEIVAEDDLKVNIDYIKFADSEVKRIALNKYDTNPNDGYVSYDEAKFNEDGTPRITMTISGKSPFSAETYISTFDEYSAFTNVTKVDDNLFKGSSLESTILPEKATSIGTGAFQDTSSLKKVTVTSAVTSVGASAFTNSSIPSIDLKGNVTTLGESSFRNDKSLSSVTGIEKVSVIPANAFRNSGNDDIGMNVGISSACTTIGDSAFTSSQVNGITIKDGSNITSVGDSAFKWCDKLSVFSVKSGDTTTTIGEEAFVDCPKLTDVHLNSGYTRVEDTTFLHDVNLSGLTDYDKIETIGIYSFMFDENLNIDFSKMKDLKSIDLGAFAYCTSLTDANFQDGIEVINGSGYCGAYDYNYHEGNISGLTNNDIDYDKTEDKNYYLKRYINLGAFYNCNKLSAVTLPNTIKYIGKNAFSQCGLKSVILPSNSAYTRVEDYCFYNNMSLTSLTIPDNVETIGHHAFESNNLNSINLNKVKKVEAYAYAENNSLSNISGASVVDIYHNAFQNDRLQEYTPKEFPKVKLIGSSAFKSNNISHVVFPTDVENMILRNYCFGSNRSKTNSPSESVLIPSNISQMGYAPFRNCGFITGFTSNNSSYRIRESHEGVDLIYGDAQNYEDDDGDNYNGTDNPSYYDNYLLQAPEGHKGTITIPTGTTSIMNYSFNGSMADDIVLNAELKEIHPHAFDNCDSKSLANLENCENLTDIDDSGCANMSNLSGITFSNKSSVNINSDAFNNDSSLVFVNNSLSIKYFGIGSFQDCTSLKGITINCESGITIDENAFQGDSKLATVNFYNTEGHGEVTINNSAFQGCSSLGSVNINCESGVTINNSAFQGCSSLGSVNINCRSDIYTYGNDFDNYTGIFQGDGALTSVTLNSSNNITIGGSVFASCSKLSSVNLTAKKITIGRYAFYNCTSLNDINIPDSVSDIGQGAFQSSSLTSVTIPDSVSAINNSAFESCTRLLNANLSSGINELSYGLFRYCSSLTSVIIPDSVTSIGYYAFQNCSSLSSITIPNSVTIIRYGAFNGCTSLSNMVISDNVTSIGDYAFDGCSKLSSIIIPSGVTSIGNYAFGNCTSLNSITFKGTVARWNNNITKWDSWHYNVPATVVTCTDGTVNLT